MGVQVDNIDANAKLLLSVAPKPGNLKCKDAEESLYKVKNMVRLHKKRRVFTREQQLAANDILAGNIGETTLENIEDFLDNMVVDDMSLLGEAITVDDVQRITSCMLNEDVDLSFEEEEANPDPVEADPDSRQLSAYTPNGQQKFCFHSSCYARCQKATRLAAISLEEQIPCISFREVDCGNGEDIMIRADYQGCSFSSSKQQINLAKGCQFKAIVEHQILHSFGMVHEHRRFDRDQFISIQWKNINASKTKQFNKERRAFTGSMYDVLSIMHLPRHAFSRNGLDTITVKKSYLTRVIGQAHGLSELDAKQMCLQYGCKDTCNPKNKNEALLKLLLDRRLVVLQNPKTGKCLDIAGGEEHDGSNLILHDCHRGFNQHWELHNDRLRNPTTNKCVDIDGPGKTNVHLWSCHGGSSQKWKVQIDGTLRNPASNKCLDIASIPFLGDNIIVWPCHADHNQIWRFKEL